VGIVSRTAERPPRGGRPLAEVTLRRGETLVVVDGAASTIEVASGAAWIAQQGSGMQFFVCGGERFTLYRRGVTRVIAQDPCRLAVRVPRWGRAPVRIAVGHGVVYERWSWRAALAGWLSAVPAPWSDRRAG